MIPKISDAEYEIMKIIWAHAPISTNDITQKLSTTTSWSPKTIHTLLNRLVKKNAITYYKEGRVFVYTSLITQKDYLDYKSNIFLDRYFEGNLLALMNNYMHSEKISDEQISCLRELLNVPQKENL